MQTFKNKDTKNREPFYYRAVGSYCPVSSHEFAEELAADIYESVSKYLGGTMEIEIYTPPYDIPLTTGKAAGGGTLVLHIGSGDEQTECVVGIEFGRFNEHRVPLRSKFDAENWEADPDNPFAADVYCANFDETFRVICLLGLMLQAVRIQISYGAYS
jgi:hypothetical protein